MSVTSENFKSRDSFRPSRMTGDTGSERAYTPLSLPQWAGVVSDSEVKSRIDGVTVVGSSVMGDDDSAAEQARWQTMFVRFGLGTLGLVLAVSVIFIVSYTSFSGDLNHSIVEVFFLLEESERLSTAFEVMMATVEIAALAGAGTAAGDRALEFFPTSLFNFQESFRAVTEEIPEVRSDFDALAADALSSLLVRNEEVIELATNGTATSLASAIAIVNGEEYRANRQLYIAGYDVLDQHVVEVSDQVRSRLDGQVIIMVIILVIGGLFTLGGLFWYGRRAMRMQKTHFGKMEKLLSHSRSLSEKVRVEKQRIRSLMLDTFPEHIVNSLIKGEQPPPEQYDSVTIVFADLVGFTKVAAASTPSEVVGMLNKLYSLFDEAATECHVFKVEIVGDQYMAVAGVSSMYGDLTEEERQQATRHWKASVNFACKIRNIVRGFEMHTGGHLGIRIGMATGPVVAALIGHTKARYCLFGDTVNTASRMESTAPKGEIQLAPSTHAFMSRHQEYSFRRREVDVKGKGVMETFILDSVDGKKLTTADDNLPIPGAIGGEEATLPQPDPSEQNGQEVTKNLDEILDETKLDSDR